MGICCMCIAVKREAAIENIQRSEKEKNITVRDVIREKKRKKKERKLVGKDFLKILIIVCNK